MARKTTDTTKVPPKKKNLACSFDSIAYCLDNYLVDYRATKAEKLAERKRNSQTVSCYQLWVKVQFGW